MKFDITEFPEWLDAELKEQNMQLKELAQRAGITPQALCGYKRRERVPSFITLECIFLALGYKIEVKKIRRKK